MFAHDDRKTPRLGWALLLPGLLLAVPAVADDYEDAEEYGDTSYSYARVVDGSSTLLEVGGDRESVEERQPILVGDRLWVPDGSRLEVVLADRSLLRFEGESQVVFESIAFSADTVDRTTQLGLSEGEVQLIVPEDVLGDALAQIRTPDGTVYVHREGSFRIRVGNGWTELVVRDGLAEMVTDRSSLLVHPGEAGWFEGGARPRIEVRLAGYRDELESWGDRLTEEAQLARVPYVDESLQYAAAPLSTYGAWIEVGGRHAWRPRVEVAWRPYFRGYWRQTPIGLTWISYDPWGFVTHHYGSWDYVGGYGWVWYPGRYYAPARVTWYWGPRYVGWCPSGYYAYHYRDRYAGFGLGYGTYGWAGGSWDVFSQWTFSLSLDFGHHRHYDRNDRYGGRDDRGRDRGRYWSAGDLARERRELDRGVITTDPGREPREAGERFTQLERRLNEISRSKGEVPDVTDFVARRPMKDNVAAAVLRRPAAAASGSKPTLSGRGDWATGDKPLPIPAGTARRSTDKPMPAPSAATSYRDKPAPVARQPQSEPSTPRPTVIERGKPAPQISHPAPSKPSPEISRPAPSKPSPEISRPAPSKPAPQVSRPAPSKPAPQVSRPAPSKPAPKASKPAPSKRESADAKGEKSSAKPKAKSKKPKKDG
jgi:Family of unknown function (DUF6600)/FecR protein